MRYSDASWLEPSWRHDKKLPMPSWGLHHVEPSWQHWDSIIWSPHDIMRAPHDGSWYIAWKVSFSSIMRAPSYGALMTSWGLHMTEPSCYHEGSTWWSPHDGMRTFLFFSSWGLQPWYIWSHAPSPSCARSYPYSYSYLSSTVYVYIIPDTRSLAWY